MTIKEVNVGAAAILFPALVLLTLISVIEAAVKAAIAEIEHMLPEFVTTWRFVTKDSPEYHRGEGT